MHCSCFSEFESNASLSELANDLVENETLRSNPFKIENFSYKNNIVMDTFFRHLENTNFHGVSVRHEYGKVIKKCFHALLQYV